MTRSRAVWSALGLAASLLTLVPAILFFSSPWPRAPAFIVISVGCAFAAGFLVARGRRSAALPPVTEHADLDTNAALRRACMIAAMGTEIERKFLVANDEWRHHVTESQAMAQGSPWRSCPPTRAVRNTSAS